MMPHAYINGQRIPFHATTLPVRCAGCRKVHCDCPDPVFAGVVPARDMRCHCGRTHCSCSDAGK